MPQHAKGILANDFVRQWEDVRIDALEACERVGRSGWLILGDEVQAFETEFASWWGTAYAVGVASGMDALEIALKCAGVSEGDRVLTTPLTAFATTLAILRVGGVPVWCDVDNSGGLDLDQAEAQLRADRSIRAILPVHLYGHPLDPAGLEQLSNEFDVVLIEDCAQSAGASRGGRATGTSGAAAGTSLYPTKNLGAMGDGGVVLTDDEAIAERARSIRNYGQRARYQHVDIGLNSRLDELHAAILRSAFLPRLDGWLRRRQQIASRYVDGLAGTPLRPIEPTGGVSARHLFAVEVVDGEPTSLAADLEKSGVSTARHYPFLCPDQPAINGAGETIGPLPVARRLAARELSLPIHPYLDEQELDAVIEACQGVPS